MKKFYLLIFIMMGFSGIAIHAQNVMNANDKDSVFTTANHPPLPSYGAIVKWGHTQSLNIGGTGTTTFKSYWYNGMQYRLKFPHTYQQGVSDGKKYPIFVFFHGAGEGGLAWDNESQLIHGGQIFRDAVDAGSFDGFLLYYQSNDGYAQNFFGDIDNVIDSLVKYNEGDKDRIIVDGLSSGGQSSWDFLANSPKYIASAAIISAARNEYIAPMPGYIHIPIWLFNGGQDTNPDPGTAQNVVNNFLALGGNLKHTFYPNDGHDTWDDAWRDPNFIPYMNAAHKANPLLYFGVSNFCPGQTISAKMGLTPGFFAYQWMKDGAVIAGATSNTYTATALGTYSARFQRLSGGTWSDWSHTPIVITGGAISSTPAITINGIRSDVLPAPDTSTTVPLIEPAGFTSYKWIHLPDSAVVSTTNIYNAPPGTYLAQITALNACSSTYSAPFTVVNANGSNGPDAASNLTAGATSAVSVQLNWSKNPHPNINETGFEVYRGTKAGGPYKLVAITPKDTVNYLDIGLAASTTYYYIVRAVNNNAGSKVTNEASAKTLQDTIPPTAPTALTKSGSSSTSVSLTWTASTDNVGVVGYDIYVNGKKTYTIPGTQTTYTVYNLVDKQGYTFQVKARDAAGNASPFSNQISANAISSGLNYSYYTGMWNNLPNFNTLTPLFTGISPNIDISGTTQQINFGYMWTGFLNVRVAGTYTLETSSDDGSALWLGTLNSKAPAYNPTTGTPLVNNDGLHAMQSATKNIALQVGTYPIAITFFQQGGGYGMQVYWACTTKGIARSLIPDSAFVEGGAVTGAAPAAPGNLVATALAYNKIGLTWQDNSTNETGFEIYRSGSASGPFAIVTTTAASVTSFTDSTVAGGTQYYYRVRAVGQFGASGYDASGAGAPYNYYNTGGLSVLPNFAAMTPTSTGIMPNFVLGMETQTTNFAVQYNTVIKITTAGNYTFSTNSDDGSALWVNGTQVVNNDGAHGPQTVSGNITLAAGTYPITVGFFQAGGGYNLSVNYSGPGVTNQVIPSSVLGVPFATATTPAAPPAPKAPYGTKATVLGSSSIGLVWKDSTNDASRFQVYRSTGNNNTYRIIATVGNTGGTNFSYTDSGLFDNVTYFYMVNATNVGGTGVFSNYDSATTLLNNPVISNPITNFTMKYGTKDTVNINFSSPDNVPITLSVLNNPAFGSLTDNGNGTGRLIFSPAASDSGTYNHIILVASATNGGSTKDTFNLVVNSNNPPVVAPIANVNFDAGSTKAITVSATDIDGLAGLTWSTTNLPAFGTLTDNHDGTATISLAPSFIQQGTYTITVTAQDVQGATSSQSFVATVNKKNPNQRFLVNMVYATSGPAPWNNMTSPKLSNLVTTDGLATNVSVSLSRPDWWQPWYLGQQTGNNSGVYPDAVLSDYYYFGIFGGPDVVYDTVSGLKPNTKYSFKFLASSNWTGIPDNGTTIYTIGSQSDSCYAQNNTSRTANINNAVSDANGNIVIAMSKAAGTQIGYLNAWEFSFKFDDSTAPALPTGLTAAIVPGIGIQLNWNAIAYNAQSYNVYRTTDTTQPFTLLNPGASNGSASTYTDSSVSGHTTYYYKLKAVNQYGDLGFTSTVNATTAARNPTVSAIAANTSVQTGLTANIAFTATDDPGDAVTVTGNLPVYANLQNLGSGNYNIVLTPAAGNIGAYSGSVTATDAFGASTTVPFVISVVESNVRSIFMHFGNDTAVAAKPWNNLLGYPFANTAFSNLQWSDGTTSGVTLTLLDQWSNAPLPLGMNTGNNSGVYPDKVLANALFENTTSPRRVKLSGLDTSKRYNLAVLTSVNGGFPSSATFVAGTQSLDLNAGYNSTATGQFNGLKADATGSLTLTMTKDAASTYGFLNSIVLQSYDNTVTMVSPNNLYVEPLFNSRTSLHLGWSDRSNNETGFQIWRSTSPNGTFAQVGTVGANVTTFTDYTLTQDTRYYYEVRANGSGGVLSGFSNIATAVTPAYIVLEHLTWKYPQTTLPWNNTGVDPEVNDIYGNLINDQGNNTGLAYTVIKTFNGEYAAGMNSGNNSYVFPDNVMVSNYWIDHGQIATLKLNGLDLTKKYRIGMEGSSTWNGDMTATMSINGRTVYLNTYMNTSKVVYIDSVISNSNGEININFSATGTYGFIGSIVVMAYTDNQYTTGTGGVTSTGGGHNGLVTTGATTALAVDSTLRTTDKLQGFQAYPNPFRDGFNIAFNSVQDSKKIDIEVFTLAGSMVYHQAGADTHIGVNILTVNMPQATPTGMYVAVVKIGGKVEKTFKLIKTK